VNDAQVRELKDALNARYPSAEDIQVKCDPDGAEIVISGVDAEGNSEAGSGIIRVSAGSWDSPVIRMLLTGRVT
jgi:hypothetical protein